MHEDPLRLVGGLVGAAVRRAQGPLRRWYHHREIQACLAEYRARTGRGGDEGVAFADRGTFRAELARLFALGSPAETRELTEIASRVVGCCLSNRYYGPSDCLADLVDALDDRTFLGTEPEGEPPLEGLAEHERRAKLRTVTEAWLVPAKVAAVESVVAGHARVVGRKLPYAALARFERAAARALALADRSEVSFLRDELEAFVRGWAAAEARDRRLAEPAEGVEGLVAVLEGRAEVDGASVLRVRRYGQPVRLSTLAPECRQAMLEAALRQMAGVQPPGTGGGRGIPAAAPVVAAAAAVALAPPEAAASGEGGPASGRTDGEGGGTGAEAGGTGAADAAGQLSIVLACPKCGASFPVDDETVSLVCEYCRSLLVVAAPERDEIGLEAANVHDPAQVLEVFFFSRLARRRTEIQARYRDAEGRSTAPPAVVDAELAVYEKLLRSRTRLVEARRVHVPYWHVHGKIVQAALGYWQHTNKRVRLRAFEVEHTVPGYDPGRANLRDRGLRLGRSRVRPLRLADVRSLGAFLPWVPVAEQTYGEIQKWCTRTLERALDPVVKHGEFLFGRRLVVYRTYWLAHVESEGQPPEWLLVDGGYGTVAGHPGSQEVADLLALASSDPLHSAEESFRKVVVVAPRCPDCGFEQDLDPRHCFVVCPNCHRGLEPRPTGIRLVPYGHHAPGGVPADADHLPFWRYRFRVELPGGQVADTLQDYAAAVFPGGPEACRRIAGDAVWIPAFRLLGTEAGDEVLKRLLEWAHATPLPVLPEKIPLGTRGRFRGATLSEPDARQLARLALFGLHPPAASARLNVWTVKHGVVGARVTLSDPTLVMVPFTADGDGLRFEGTDARVPFLLLEGGPALEARRATVYQLQQR